jgi:hypothetical protein
MNIRFILLGGAASLLFTATSFADPPSVPRAAKVVPPASSSLTPVKTPMPAATAATPLSKAALNPQPLPPKVWGGNAGDASSLNPQPLPPKIGNASGVMKASAAQSKAKTAATGANAGATTAQP